MERANPEPAQRPEKRPRLLEPYYEEVCPRRPRCLLPAPRTLQLSPWSQHTHPCPLLEPRFLPKHRHAGCHSVVLVPFHGRSAWSLVVLDGAPVWWRCVVRLYGAGCL